MGIIIKYMKKLNTLLLLLLLQSCNTDNKPQNTPIFKDNSQAQNLKSNYNREANKVYTFIFDTLRPMENTLIYDTLCFFDYLDNNLIKEVLLNVDSTFSKDEGIAMIENFNKHKSDDIGNIITNTKYKALISTIDSVNNVGRFFLALNYFMPNQLLLSAPMFNNSYTKCLTYVVSYYYITENNILDIQVNGTYIYLEKDINNFWKPKSIIYEPQPIPSQHPND